MSQLDEIKAEVKHVKLDYYDGVPILSLKEIEWLIKQAEKVEFYEGILKAISGIEDNMDNHLRAKFALKK